MHEYQSQDITTLAKALIQVQRNLQPAFKDATNPFTKSSYATLNSVMAACRDALLDNGIWLLGDRNLYIGMSDIGRYLECPRATLANKLLSANDHPLERLLRLEC